MGKRTHSQLTEEEKQQIREAIGSDKMLALYFNVSVSTIRYIKNKRIGYRSPIKA